MTKAADLANLTLASGRELKFVDTNESIKSDGSKIILKSGGTTFNFPTSDGSANQLIKTDGSGTLSFATVGGAILQLKSTSSTTSTSSYSTSYANNGVSSLSITPAATSNKILVLYSVANYINTTTSGSVAMFRDSTNIITNSVIGGYFTSAAAFLDDPQSTSSITYQLKHKLNSAAGGTFIYSQANGSTSSLTLMEISSSVL